MLGGASIVVLNQNWYNSKVHRLQASSAVVLTSKSSGCALPQSLMEGLDADVATSVHSQSQISHLNYCPKIFTSQTDLEAALVLKCCHILCL
jgi:hypothetical protein